MGKVRNIVGVDRGGRISNLDHKIRKGYGVQEGGDDEL